MTGTPRPSQATTTPPVPRGRVVTPAVDGPKRYRFEHPTLMILKDDLLVPKSDLGPGDHVPAFELPTTDGGRIMLGGHSSDRRPVLLVFGSLTCPVTQSAAAGLRELHARHGNDVRFVVVNVREAHPGASTGQPRSDEQKLRHARALRATHGFDFEVAVDDIDGSVHRMFGPRPNSAYILDPDGTILFRAQWANLTRSLDEALAAAVANRTMRRATVSRTPVAIAKMIGHADVALRTAGPGALRDTWKVAAPLAAMITVSRLFRSVARDQRGLLALGISTLVLVGAVATLAIVV